MRPLLATPILLFSTSLLVMACGQVRAPIPVDERRSDSSEQRYYPSHEAALAAMEMASLRCSSLGDCPEAALAMYTVSLKQPSVSACSASLIGERTILTNAHCLPADLWRNGSSCQDRVRFAFAETLSQPARNIGCDRVIKTSWHHRTQARERTFSTLELDVDWAIIELEDSPEREPLTLNQQVGIPLGSKAQILAVHFQIGPGQEGDQLRPIRCQANTSSYLTKHFLGPLSPIFNVSDCSERVRRGHSGSAVLNGNNELVGVFAFNVELTEQHLESQEVRDWIQDKAQAERLLAESFAGGTQVACIPFEPHQPLNPLCDFDKQEHNTELLPSYHRLLEVQQHDSFNEVREQMKEQFTEFEAADSRVEWEEAENVEVIPFVEDRGEGGAQRLSPQRRWLDQERIRTLFPYLPKCIKSSDELKDDFQLRTPVIQPNESSEVDKQTFRRRRRPHLGATVVSFAKMEDGTGYYARFSQRMVVEVPFCSE